jgi:hypothetical protein
MISVYSYMFPLVSTTLLIPVYKFPNIRQGRFSMLFSEAKATLFPGSILKSFVLSSIRHDNTLYSTFLLCLCTIPTS